MKHSVRAANCLFILTKVEVKYHNINGPEEKSHACMKYILPNEYSTLQQALEVEHKSNMKLLLRSKRQHTVMPCNLPNIIVSGTQLSYLDRIWHQSNALVGYLQILRHDYYCITNNHSNT